MKKLILAGLLAAAIPTAAVVALFPADAQETAMTTPRLTGNLEHDEPIVCAADFIQLVNNQKPTVMDDYARIAKLSDEDKARLYHGCYMFNLGILFTLKSQPQPAGDSGAMPDRNQEFITQKISD